MLVLALTGAITILCHGTELSFSGLPRVQALEPMAVRQAPLAAFVAVPDLPNTRHAAAPVRPLNRFADAHSHASKSRIAFQLDMNDRGFRQDARKKPGKKGEKPVITGQNPNPLMASEDVPFTLELSNLVVTDPDSEDSEFTMRIHAGPNYTASGNTVTPAPDFNGMLAVRVSVSDGENDSGPYNVQVSVVPENDAPVITGQNPNPLTATASRPFDIVLENLVVSDPDNAYPGDFSLAVLPGDHYAVAGNTVTPAAGFSGMLAVNVTVSDGAATSGVFPVQVSVTGNTAPVITGQATLTTNEEVPLTIDLSDLTVSDPDSPYPEAFSLRLLGGDDYTTDGSTVVPAPDFAGILVVPVIISDGVSDSPPFDLQVTVLNINDAPVITGQAALATEENQALTISLADLAVADPDSEYPGAFTLSIMAGENYSVSGTTVTPLPGFNGVLTVPVFVNDGVANSNFFPLSITVSPVNDPPVITGQTELQVNEDTPITVSLQHLSVMDPDTPFPEGFTLIVQPGSNYSAAGNIVTPAPDFAGTLSVNVVVNDGTNNSAPFPLQIVVLPVNDAPVITGPASLTTNEDVAKTLALTDFSVADPDNAFPSGFGLTVFPGAHYTVSGTTVTPEPDFSGTLKVEVQITDGLLTSNVFTVDLNVIPVNDVPVITGQTPLSTSEDTPVAIDLSDLTVLDIDNPYPVGFSLAISPGDHYTFSGTVITPSPDFNGTLNVTITVSDGMASSAPFAFQIQVGDTNDAPVITGQTAVITEEEHPVTLTLSNLIVSDPDNAYPDGFTLLVSPGMNYTVSGQTITPELNFSGVLTVPVRVNDGINNSATFDLHVQVNPINDPPSFAAIPNQQVSENSTAGSLTITGISKGPGEDDQQLTFVARSGNTAVVGDPTIQYAGTGSTATLSYPVKPNTSGIVTVTVTAIDNGSNVPPNQNSYSSSFQIEVVEINSAPTLDVINSVTILEDAEEQNISLTGISAGAGETQTLMASVSSTHPEFFEALEVLYTSPESTGVLRFKTKADVHGTAQVSVTITDDGPGVSPHANTITRTFNVVIQPVNDPPYFSSSPPTLAAVDEVYEYHVKAIDPDGDKLAFQAPGIPGWATFISDGKDGARLMGKPPASAAGETVVKLQASDGSDVAEQSFTLAVNTRPSVTALTVATPEDDTLSFPADFFQGGYSDANNNPLMSVQIVSTPAAGRLFLSGRVLSASDTVPARMLSALRYAPDRDFFGEDTFTWKAFDGFHMSARAASVNVSVLPVNDPPLVQFERDTLLYEVDGEPAFLSPLLAITDVDDDSLTQATVSFQPDHYRPELDVLAATTGGKIKAVFNYQTGALQLTGEASVEDYVTALRGVTYLHLNTLDPILEPKTLLVTLNDGEAESEPRAKTVVLRYTFVEFNIPSGFTPNGDHANDTWVIERPGGGLEELDDAIISVYNRKGVLVFRARGFDRPWDGTMNGELLPADSYFYTIDLRLRNKKTYKGIVTLLR